MQNTLISKVHAELFSAFFRIGIFGFGGGPTMIPLVHQEVVQRYQWMDDDEFSNTLAIGNTLPGPIATKMAGYIGYKTGGIIGCLLAVIATVVPLVLVMILALTTLNKFKDLPWVAGMAKGVVPVVCWMMIKLTWDFMKKGQVAIGLVYSSVLIGLCLALILLAGINAGIIVATVLVFAALKPVSSKPGKAANP